MKSPCKKICIQKDDLCIGCGRTMNEIMLWQSMSVEEKMRCVRSAKERLDNA